MKEDYAEKVIELLCEKIDELEKEIKDIKYRFTTGTTVTYGQITGTPSVTHNILCPTCGSYPCRCGCFGTGKTTFTLL